MLQKVTWLQFWILLIAVSVASLQSLPEGAALPTNDKLLHLIGYTGLAISAKIAYPLSPRTSLLWLSLLGFSISLEFLQSLVPGRSCDTGDMVANGAGLLLGLMLYRSHPLLQRWIRFRQPRQP